MGWEALLPAPIFGAAFDEAARGAERTEQPVPESRTAASPAPSTTTTGTKSFAQAVRVSMPKTP
jgi:hypothetical protein